MNSRFHSLSTALQVCGFSADVAVFTLKVIVCIYYWICDLPVVQLFQFREREMKLKASSEELVNANTLGPSGDSSQVFNRIEISQLKFYDYLILFVY